MTASRSYHRQMLVTGIGSEGQRRIAAARAPLGGDGPEHEIATRYALSAGFAGVDPGTIEVDRLAPPFVETPGARAVLAGARAAVRALRSALDGSVPDHGSQTLDP